MFKDYLEPEFLSKPYIYTFILVRRVKARDKMKSKKAWKFSIERKFLSKNFIARCAKIIML